ncbi:MAG: urease accessory protein UreF [Hyphomicrobiaceae bacterium]
MSKKGGGSGDPSSERGEGLQPLSRSDIDPRLLVWLSPSFPVGAFAYSHGLELAADRGWIAGRDGLEAWLVDLVRQGSLRNDLILLAAAFRAAAVADVTALRGIGELALALQPSAERRLETVTQGTAFVATIAAAWPPPPSRELDGALDGEVAYPVGVGVIAARHGMGLAGTLMAYSIAFAGNLVSAAIRLSLVGQTDGQRVVAALMPTLRLAAEAATSSTLDDIGGSALRSDLASLAHETQYSRLFRS